MAVPACNGLSPLGAHRYWQRNSLLVFSALWDVKQRALFIHTTRMRKVRLKMKNSRQQETDERHISTREHGNSGGRWGSNTERSKGKINWPAYQESRDRMTITDDEFWKTTLDSCMIIIVIVLTRWELDVRASGTASHRHLLCGIECHVAVTMGPANDSFRLWHDSLALKTYFYDVDFKSNREGVCAHRIENVLVDLTCR